MEEEYGGYATEEKPIHGKAFVLGLKIVFVHVRCVDVNARAGDQINRRASR